MFEIQKRINRIKIKLGYTLRLSKAIGMPKLITVEPTNHCDLKCPLCPTGVGDKSVEYGLFKLEKYKKVIDVFGKWAQTIQLFSWGEPTLNKSFVEMVRYASQDPYKIRSSTCVNLNNVTDEQIKGLVTSNLDMLTLSIDGITQEVYEKYRVGGNLETVFNNLKKLIAAKKLYKSKTKIQWAFLVFKHNEHQLEEAKKMADDFGIHLEIKAARPHIKKDLHNNSPEEVDAMINTYGKWLSDTPKYNVYNMETKKRKNDFSSNSEKATKPLKMCRRPWWTTFINWNGDVFPCDCVHTEAKYRMGNIFEQDFKEIWNGKKYIAARKELLDQPNELETICHTCKKNGFAFTR
jgi:radical SAM protein with 4Fe4S-binding SPASM domain